MTARIKPHKAALALARAVLFFLFLNVLAAAAILAAAPNACAQRRATRPSAQFGRFGKLHDDGLLTLNVHPDGFSSPPTAPPLDVLYGTGASAIRVTRASVDSTGKRLTLAGGGDGAPNSLNHTLLYPGFSANFGTRATLRFVDKGGKPRAPKVRVTHLKPFVLTVIPSGSLPDMPLAIVVEKSAAPISWKLDGATLSISSARTLGTVRFVTPTGISPVPDDATLGAALEPWVLRNVPTRIASTATLSKDGARVTVTDIFDTDFAPLSPVLVFAIENGYPAKIDGAIEAGAATTKWGPFASRSGRFARYELPVPPTSARGYARSKDIDPARVALLNEFVGHLGGDWAKNAVDLGYAGMANAQLSASFLSVARQKELAAAWRKYLPRAFVLKEPAWKRRVEPISGRAYFWTYKIDGPGGYDYDLDWGNALPLYGLATYARYSGDWRFVANVWRQVSEIQNYFTIADDWAWMTAVNAEHGYSTGTGDPLCATYAASVASLNMARTLGDKKATEKYAAWAARCAVATVARFYYTDWARKNGLIGETSVVLGFHETEGFTRSRLGADDPWDATTLISGDGALPELAALYEWVAKEAVARYEAVYERAYPNWADGGFAYPFPTTYSGNSVYVGFPHIYLRAIVLSEDGGLLWRAIDSLSGNRNNAWIGPNVVGELLGRESPLLVIDWARAGFVGAVWNPSERIARVSLRVGKPGTFRCVVRLTGGWRVRAVTLSGRALKVESAGGGRFFVSGKVAPGDISLLWKLETAE